MDMLIQGGITLATVIATFLLTFYSTRSSERARWKREYDVRWDVRRMEAIAEYAGATKKLLTLSWDVSKSRGLGTSVSPRSVKEGSPLIDEAESDRGEKFEIVLLLVSEQTRQLGRRWHGFAWEFARIAKGEVKVSPDVFMAIRDKCFEARDEFYASARSELGVDPNSYSVDLRSLEFHEPLVSGEA
ncbi:hypothetical protein [Agreia sp. Leaf283]|uniref:hypothetical protein n=1 Tax=Agreia sp. Leaf283 TaxID=1736321 RepID=UPI000AA8A6A3|nr:hypothetical protein [Agreia sp. Leaf283]